MGMEDAKAFPRHCLLIGERLDWGCCVSWEVESVYTSVLEGMWPVQNFQDLRFIPDFPTIPPQMDAVLKVKQVSMRKYFVAHSKCSINVLTLLCMRRCGISVWGGI